MTEQEQKMFRAIGSFVDEEIKKAVAPMKERIEALENELRENPVFKFLGVWNFETTYRKHNAVSYQGSLWICTAPSTKDVPGGPEGTWTLAVKRGKDAKEKAYAVA